MEKKKKKIWIITVVCTTIILVVLIIGNFILKNIVRQKFNTALAQLAPFVEAKYREININLLSASAEIDSFSIEYIPEPAQAQHKHDVYLSSVHIGGINFFKLISGKNFTASLLQLNNAQIKLDKYLLDKKDTVALKILSLVKLPFENASFGKIELLNADVKEINNKHESSILSGDVTLRDVNLLHIDSSFSIDSAQFSGIESSFNNINYALPGYHTMHIKKLMLSSKDSILQIDSFGIISEPGKFELGRNAGHQPDNINAVVPSIGVTGFDVMKLRQKNFTASLLQLKNAQIKVDKSLLDRKDTVVAKTLSLVKLPFENVSFGKIELLNAEVKEINGKDESSLFNCDLTLSDLTLLHIDSTFSLDSIRFSSIESTLNNITYALPGYHTVHIKKIMLSSEDSMLRIDSLDILPQLGKFELGKKLGHQADRINASVKGIAVTGLDVMKLREKKFIAAEMNIHNSVVYIFRDRRLRRELKNQLMPADYLKKLPAYVHIDNFKLNDVTVTSEEFPKTGEKTGFIKIMDITINMKPLFNKPDSRGHSTLTAYVKGNIMNAGNIHATINLSLLTGNEDIKGAIENLNLPALNPSAENLGNFHIRSGVLNHLSFAFTGNNKKAEGEIVGEYHDLVIDRLKDTKQGKETATLPTFALHSLIIPKNKDASMPVENRTGKIDYERDPTRFVTFFYIKALLDGIRDSFTLGFLLPK